MSRITTSIGLAALLSVAAGSVRAAPFTFTNIIDPLNPAFTQALGINGSNTVVGYGNASNFNGFQVTAPFASGNFTRENFPGAAATQVTGIDGGGDTVGFYVDASGNNHGFTRIGGVFSTADQPGTSFTQLLGINQSGAESAGYSSTNPAGTTLQQAFTLATGTSVYTNINSLLVTKFGPNFNSQASGVNNAGTVVGFYQPTSTTFNGFEDKGGLLTSVTVPGAVDTMALGINDLGEIVGDYTLADGDMFGFLDNGGSISTLDPFGSTAVTANGINDLGQIVGFYTDANGNTIGFEAATFVAEPGSLSLLLSAGLVGLAGVLLRRRRVPA